MKQYFCVGTYTEPILFGTGEVFHGKGEGIYLCAFDGESVSIVSSVPARNPSFLCIDERRKRIYAVNELKEYLGAFGGGVTTLSYDDKGEMTIVSTYGTGGTDPCHIVGSPDGKLLVISNFASGSITTFPLDEDGEISPEKQLFQHTGSSVHPVRQRGPHAHSAIFSDGSLMLVPDLGLDQLVCYSYNKGQIQPNPDRTIKVEPGSGPRAGEFSPDGRHFYLINEIGSSITHFEWDWSALNARETVSTLPIDYKGANICSDLHITPDGKHLYASNRGHDSIAVFAIGGNGALKFVDRISCRGKTPRNFAIDPLGHYVLVGNQDSDTIVVFSIEKDGRLSFVSETPFPTPVCIRFFHSDPAAKHK